MRHGLLPDPLAVPLGRLRRPTANTHLRHLRGILSLFLNLFDHVHAFYPASLATRRRACYAGWRTMRRERLQVPDVELSRPALVLAQRFVQRWDLYARQLNDGRYICVHEMLGVDHLFSHLRGDLTLGAYLLDEKSRARYIVFDADDQKGFSDLVALAGGLASEEIPSYLETSRRGGHLWLFFEKPVSGRRARSLGLGILAAHQLEGIELFPKQEKLAGGPGSLIRMPFGIHRLSHRRYDLVTPEGQHLAPTIREQIDAFRAPETVPPATFDAYRTSVSSRGTSASLKSLEEPTDTVSERIKASVTVLEFVSQFVDLKPTGSGAIGSCPFHEDHHPSFGVNDEGNYWHCFAGCGGGSVIDFWMKFKRVDFTTAVRQLAKLLL